MADEQSTDPFDAVMQRNIAEKSASSQQNEDPFDLVMQKKTSAPSTEAQKAAAADPYEAKIQSYMPEAQKRAAALGTFGGVESGISRIPILGDIVSEIGADISAALPSSISEAEGQTYGERRQNIKAGLEAMKRATAEQNPKTALASEIGGSLLLPAGGIAGIGEAATGSRLAGLAAEGAGYGAASAAASKIGTTPKSEQPNVGESALIGGGLGAGLGAAGSLIGTVAEKFAPDWMKAIGSGKNNFQLRELAKAYDQDVKSGNVKMTFDDYQKAMSAGQPVQVTDLGGPAVQSFIKRAFQDQPELADDFRQTLVGRIQTGNRRFTDFAQDLTDSDLNANEIKEEAKKVARQETNNAYEVAYAPENARGAWDEKWNNYINLPEVRQAIIRTEEELVKEAQYKAASSGSKASQLPQIESPFITKMEIVGASPVERFEFVNPDAVNAKYLDYFQRNLNDTIDSLPGSTRGGVKSELIGFRRNIIDSLIDPKSDNYNPAYAKAFNSTNLFRGENDAFTFGLNFFGSRRSALKSSAIQNATSQMTDKEKEFFTQGVMADMLSKSRMPDGSVNAKTLQSYFTPGPMFDSLKNAMDPVQLQDLQRFAKTESVISDAVQQAKRLGGSQQRVTHDLETIIAFQVFNGLGLARIAAQFGNKFFGDKYARSLIAKLSSNDPSQIRAAYDQLTSNPATRAGVVKMLATLAAQGGLQGAAMTGKKEGGSVLDDSPPIEMPHSLQELQGWNKNRAKPQSMDDVFTGRVSGFEGASPLAMPVSLTELQSYKRTKRATGGRIPDVDKLFKEAKKTLDGQTKPMLNVHDDAIVHALRIAQGRV